MGCMLVSTKVCSLIDKTFVMGHQLPVLEWFLDLKMNMIIVGFNSLGTFLISLMVLYTFIDVFKNVILKKLYWNAIKAWCFTLWEGLDGFLNFLQKDVFAYGHIHILCDFGGHINLTFYSCLLDELVVLICFLKFNI
jgi:hypothetical protein